MFPKRSERYAGLEKAVLISDSKNMRYTVLSKNKIIHIEKFLVVGELA